MTRKTRISPLRYLKYAFLLLLPLVPSQLQAIPAWARMTGASCATCHAIPTLQLTATGLEFLRNGYRMEPTTFKPSTQNLGDYVSLTAEKQFTVVSGANPSTKFEQPVVQLASGGPLSDHFSFMVMYKFNSSSDPTQNLEAAILQYNLPIAKDTFLSIRGGQFTPQILRTFGLGAASYVTPPLVLTTNLPVGLPATATTGTFNLGNDKQGMDVQLNWKAFEIAAGIFNPTTVTAVNPTNRKDTYASVIWRFDDYASGIGSFRYDGQTKVFDTTDTTQAPQFLFSDDFYRNGLLFRFIRDKWRCMSTYFEGQHQIDASGTKAKNRGYYGLIEFNPMERLGVFVRYDKLQPDTKDSTLDQKVLVAGCSGMLFHNDKSGARWVLEASKTDFNDNVTPPNKQVLLNIVVAY